MENMHTTAFHQHYILSLTIKMKNHNLIQSPPKVKQKIHEIYCGELGKDGYESKKGA